MIYARFDQNGDCLSVSSLPPGVPVEDPSVGPQDLWQDAKGEVHTRTPANIGLSAEVGVGQETLIDPLPDTRILLNNEEVSFGRRRWANPGVHRIILKGRYRGEFIVSAVDVRQRKWEEIKAIREEKFKTTNVPGLGIIDSDERGRENIRLKIEQLDRQPGRPATTALKWRLHNNKWEQITLKQLRDAQAAITDARDAINETAWALEEQINAPSATLEQINAINWPG